MIKASIDLGTNTCLLLIAEWDPNRKTLTHVLGDYAQVVRLGEGVDQARQLQPAPMERALACLKDYADKVKQAKVNASDVICVATSQARDAKNSAEFFSRIRNETGFSFRVISGEEEAHATFVGALLPGMDPKSSSVIDIGGGSTEIISLNHKQSINIGSVRFTERFLKSDPVNDEEFWACQAAIDAALDTAVDKLHHSFPALPPSPATPVAPIVAVAGTATTLAAWHLGIEKFDAKKVDSVILTRGDIHRMVEELKWRTIEEEKVSPLYGAHESGRPTCRCTHFVANIGNFRFSSLSGQHSWTEIRHSL